MQCLRNLRILGVESLTDAGRLAVADAFALCESLEVLHLSAVSRTGRRLDGKWGSGEDVLRLWTRSDCCRERLHRRLIKAFLDRSFAQYGPELDDVFSPNVQQAFVNSLIRTGGKTRLQMLFGVRLWRFWPTFPWYLCLNEDGVESRTNMRALAAFRNSARLYQQRDLQYGTGLPITL
eukprot:scaffold1954_cov268-Pinguiococcus_pyrenoidosus.AAC.166